MATRKKACKVQRKHCLHKFFGGASCWDHFVLSNPSSALGSALGKLEEVEEE